MKQSLLPLITACLTIASIFACQTTKQDVYPVKGVFKQTAMTDGNSRLTKIPTIAYKTHAGRYSMLVWPYGGSVLAWRMEITPDANDPFCQKIKTVNKDSLILTWYNTYDNMFGFPTNTWIDEEWSRVDKSDTILPPISDVFTNHNSKGKLLGTWKLCSTKVPDLEEKKEFMITDYYRIYGVKHYMDIEGSLYNIEKSHSCAIFEYEWTNEQEYKQDDKTFNIEFVNPDKFIMKSLSTENKQIITTWVRVSVPEPAATVFSAFK